MTSKSGKGIDYSKWDRMDFSDDSFSDSEDDAPRPHVTSLDQPGRVTLRPDGTLEIGQSDSSSVSNSHQVTTSNNPKGVDIVKTATSRKADFVKAQPSNGLDEKCDKKSKTKTQQLEEHYTRNGGIHNSTVNIASTHPNDSTSANDCESNTKNLINCPIYWSQDRHTVTLRIAFPPDVFPSRSIRVRVTGALNYADRFSAVGRGGTPSNSCGDQSHGTLEVFSVPENTKISISNNSNVHKTQQPNEILILKGYIPRPIHLFQDEEEIGFDIEDNSLGMDISNISKEEGDVTHHLCSKFVVVTLPKAVPMEGMVLWWDCPLTSFPKLDVGSIRDRNVNLAKSSSVGSGHAGLGYGKSAGGSNGDGGDVSGNKKEAFQKAWEEAHAMFREKVKKKEVQYVNVDE
mmetsp:Transcript_27352/g.57525  ORF Transcript_27352/g.57525 Transcript_27352/m.57525 type:complete len:402 (+) Transcript_27352:105-1310(+)